jgi:predicted enzyme related to lactoylglutathione lyase
MFKGPLGGMIYVPDVVKSVKFYKDILGFEFAGYWDSEKCVMEWDKKEQPFYAGFNLDGSHFGIHPNEKECLVGTSIEFYRVVENADDYYQQVKKNGGQCDAPHDTPWGRDCL